ncbi:Choline dehydrogenase [Phytophthora palmivora]|uniref:Choline dehydrogenase n=1 Tax=Phytophthora palmivora TaxID=4796 RepID=A0A2P4YUG4_9STRA|nr:Choline dehydrogenase [Phytophthora palmivora]
MPNVDERSSLLRPGVSQRIGRRTRLLVSGLALLLLFIGAVGCVAIMLRLLRGAAGPTPPITPLILSEEVNTLTLLILQDTISSPLNTKGLTPFDVPFYWTNVANTPSLHWAYPDVNVAKALGGCGIHNAMLYIRALPTDMGRWKMDKWTWEKALDIYMSIEDFDGPNSSYHSTRGFLRTSPPSLKLDISAEFIEACAELGIPRTEDFNAPDGRYGAGYYHFNTRDGVRESAAKAFLGPILDSDTAQSTRSNFRLMLDTTVTKIGINDENVTEGVEVRYGNGTVQLIRLAEHGEVIVTAGAINTPKILMLSGLGNRDTLKKAGLPLTKHLPRVGMNLQDHPVVGMIFECEAPRIVDLKMDLDSYFKATSTKHANASSFGLFGSAGLSAGAFLIPPGSTIPEIQLTLFPRKSEPHMSNSAGLNHMTQVVVTIALLHPLARNRVVLVHDDRDSVDDNDIDNHLIPRVVSEVPDAKPEHLREGDVWKISWAMGVVREIAKNLAEKKVIGRELSPGADVASSKDLNNWVFNNVFRNSHWVGSASMGKTEVEGVVDNHLRVFGVKNLRVADASVIPLIPNGNVHSSVVMVANRAAQIIREDQAKNRQHNITNAE